VDFSKFKTPDWLMIGGGLAMLILGLLLDWTSVDTGFGSVTLDGPFNYFLTGGLAWLLVVAVGVLVVLRGLDVLPPTQPWALIFLGATGLAVLLMLIQILLGGREGTDRGIGMWGALVWAAISAAGAFLNFKAEGGELAHLTDVNKLKSSFSSGAGGNAAPPPPPPPAPAPPAPAPPAPSTDPTPPPAAPPPPSTDPTPPPPAHLAVLGRDIGDIR